MSALERYEAAAREWNAGGRDRAMLVAGRDLVALRLWAQGREGLSKLLSAHLRASEKAQPAGWLDDELAMKAGCALCKTPYRVENLLLCTQLPHAFCHDCVSGERRGADGVLPCACGGELVG